MNDIGLSRSLQFSVTPQTVVQGRWISLGKHDMMQEVCAAMAIWIEGPFYISNYIKRCLLFVQIKTNSRDFKLFLLVFVDKQMSTPFLIQQMKYSVQYEMLFIIVEIILCSYEPLVLLFRNQILQSNKMDEALLLIFVGDYYLMSGLYINRIQVEHILLVQTKPNDYWPNEQQINRTRTYNPYKAAVHSNVHKQTYIHINAEQPKMQNRTNGCWPLISMRPSMKAWQNQWTGVHLDNVIRYKD